MKTPEDVAKLQASIADQIKKALVQGGYPAFLASLLASQLTGIPQSEQFAYQHLNSAKTTKNANQIAAMRGSVGSSESIIGNFQDVTVELQKITAGFDKLLSTGDIAKTISIKVAHIKADVVNFLNKGLDSANKRDDGIVGTATRLAKDIFHMPQIRNTNQAPSSSSQVKAGGG